MQGMQVSPEEIVITNGAMEALNLSMQAITEPGDWIVIESPCFYGTLQVIERLKLKVVAIVTILTMEWTCKSWKMHWFVGQLKPVG